GRGSADRSVDGRLADVSSVGSIDGEASRDASARQCPVARAPTPYASSASFAPRRSRTHGHASGDGLAWSSVAWPSTAAAGPGSPIPTLDVHGTPMPSHGPIRPAAPACVDRGCRSRGIQQGRVLTRVSAYVKPGPDLEPYIEDALDEIEYLTGPAASTWGSLRARAGHPAPFKLTYVEVGNEDFFDRSGSYDQRFAQFNQAIKARYPSLQVISTAGFEHPENQRVRSVTPDVVDEHYYRTVEAFLKAARGQYDKYDRKGPKVFVGEWGTYETPFEPWNPRSRAEAPTPNLRAAIGDGAW